ncbi:MAG: hypothetical protein EXQ50_01345 [Acidobacteria bacterium]|nr:hypothetical protein [Acidobacteriota bacterium]MSO83119.1 hypothetical protein [Acidobacteriota bacterium]
MITVLFACVHNAGRSQIAAALFNRRADPTKARAISAGTQPADCVHPEAVAVMRARGVDLALSQCGHSHWLPSSITSLATTPRQMQLGVKVNF